MAQTTVDPGDLVARVRRDVGRNLSRARNGVKYVTGIDKPQVGTTPKSTGASDDCTMCTSSSARSIARAFASVFACVASFDATASFKSKPSSSIGGTLALCTNGVFGSSIFMNV